MYKWNIDFYMKSRMVVSVVAETNHKNSNDFINEIFMGKPQGIWTSFLLRENRKKSVYVSLDNVSHYEIFE